MEDVTTQLGKVLIKPNLINEYNKFMAGVDHCDRMLSYYPCEHKTLIWYKKLAIHIFQTYIPVKFIPFVQERDRKSSKFLRILIKTNRGFTWAPTARSNTYTKTSAPPRVLPKRRKRKG